MHDTELLDAMLSAPHYEIRSSEFAKWLDEEAGESWWNVDGDPLLTGRLSFPCPSDELSEELRTLDRPLLILAIHERDARGQTIDAGRVSALSRYARDLGPDRDDDRFFDLCWKGSTRNWLLIEDVVSARQDQNEVVSMRDR